MDIEKAGAYAIVSLVSMLSIIFMIHLVGMFYEIFTGGVCAK